MVNSLYPISENENDFLFKKELIGKWRDIKDSSVYYQVDTVAGSGKKLYLATIVSLNEKNRNIKDTTNFRVKLIQIERSFFIDCQLDIESSFPQKKDDYDQWLIARHFVYKISFGGADQIEISDADPDKLLQLIDENKIHLSYYKITKDNYLILNKPTLLQAALNESQHYYSLLYKDKDTLIRVK
jgi:hypothetical protein